MAYGKSDLVDVDVELVHATEDAWLVNTGDDDENVWVPKSQCELDHSGSCSVLTLPEWLALEKGLI